MDDMQAYRPGIKAVEELGVKSPLREAGFTKEEVRTLAGEYGVSVARRPSTPCLPLSSQKHAFYNDSICQSDYHRFQSVPIHKSTRKCEALQRLMKRYTKENVVVAFSGGADSSLLLKLAVLCARESEKKVYAITADTQLHPVQDLQIARQVAEETGAIHMVLEICGLEQTGIYDNPIYPAPYPLSIFTTAIPFAQEFTIVNNADRPFILAPYPTEVGTAITGPKSNMRH